MGLFPFCLDYNFSICGVRVRLNLNLGNRLKYGLTEWAVLSLSLCVCVCVFVSVCAALSGRLCV